MTYKVGGRNATQDARRLAAALGMESVSGAGLTNAIFMPPESTVIEVTSADKLAEPGLRFCFYSLLSSLNYGYTPLLAESLDARDPNANLTVSPAALAPLLSTNSPTEGNSPIACTP